MISRMPKLDPNSREFRDAGHRIVDWVADYLDNVDRYDVLSRVQPGDVEKQFDAKPHDAGKSYELMGGDPAVVKAGARVRVTGYVAVGVMSHCMQGQPFRVTEAHAL